MKPIVNKFIEIKQKLIIPEGSFKEFDRTLFNILLERIMALIIRQFGRESSYLKRLNQFEKKSWMAIGIDSVQQLHGIIDIIIDDIELNDKKDEVVYKPIQIEQDVKRIANEINILNNKVFIVHGHNESMK